MKINFLIIIGIVIFGTFAAMVAGSIASSYLYNKIWLASGNDLSECMKFVYVENCTLGNEYLEGLDFWGKLVSFGILIIGVVIGVIICKNKIPTLKNGSGLKDSNQ